MKINSGDEAEVSVKTQVDVLIPISFELLSSLNSSFDINKVCITNVFEKVCAGFVTVYAISK